MKFKKTLAIVVSLSTSHFLAYPVGHWFDSQYATGGGWLPTVGPFPGYLDGFTLSYVLISSLLIYLISGQLKFGIYAALPVVVIDLLLGAVNPQLWMDLILLAAGLTLAWTILFAKEKMTKQ